jgi:Xaa-Pro aminopeptidase
MVDIHPIVDGYSADICRTLCAGKPTSAQQTAYGVYQRAQQSAIAKVAEGVQVSDLEKTLLAVITEAGHKDHVFGPPIHGVGIEFEEAPLPSGHAFFHGEKAAEPLRANTVLAIGNCGLYTGPWGVRVEDTLLVTKRGSKILTVRPYGLTM